MDLEVIGEDGVLLPTVQIDDIVFNSPFRAALVHQVVVAFRANGRLGTRAQKTRGTVRHSTKKPWRQKGTGRARAGMVSSPLWRGGGRTFPSSPDENFSQKINKKMYRAAMCSVFSQLAREKRISLLDVDCSLDRPKTAELYKKLQRMGFSLEKGCTLLLSDSFEKTPNLVKASRNLPNFDLALAVNIGPLSLVGAESVLMTRGALDGIRARFS